MEFNIDLAFSKQDRLETFLINACVQQSLSTSDKNWGKKYSEGNSTIRPGGDDAFLQIVV